MQSVCQGDESVLFCFSHPPSEGWPHHRSTFSICFLSFWLSNWLFQGESCPRIGVVFLPCVHLALFPASYLTPGNSLVSLWCDHSMPVWRIVVRYYIIKCLSSLGRHRYCRLRSWILSSVYVYISSGISWFCASLVLFFNSSINYSTFVWAIIGVWCRSSFLMQKVKWLPTVWFHCVMLLL